MTHRLTTLVLAAIVVGVLAADDQMRTGPILIAVAMLFAATLVRPTVRLRELTLAATVAVGALSSLAAGLIAASGAIAVLALSEFGLRRPADRPTRMHRSMPVLLLTGCVIVAIGLGDRRTEPPTDVDTKEPSPTEFEPTDSSDTEQIDRAIVDRSDALAVELARPQYDPLAAAEISAAITELNRTVIDVSPGEGAWGVPGRPFVDTGGEEVAQPLRWWWALIITVVVIAGLVLSLRIRGSSSMLQLAAPGTPPEPAPLDWYDRIVEAAGHPRGAAEPVLGHSRRLADRTGDERFRQLGRIVSNHVYNAKPFTDADLDLIRRLRQDGPSERER